MKIALIGYGKMGKAIEAIALQKGHTIGLKIDADNQDALTRENLQQQDVAIEFTNPNSAVKNIMACIDAGIPIVSGSTGWLDKWEKVKNYCTEKQGTLLYASNFSIGVNLFFEINKRLASLMAQHSEYDVTVEEIHHTEKKDAPSGTAITIAEQILAHNLHKTNWVNETPASADQLSIISKRIDPAPGTHHVKYSSPIDDIEIIHTAHNRSGFAMGAVMAASYIKDKKGIFTMQDVLDIS
jgi:4-hydroxy-tetrahydrodipicolinate reductase